MVDSSIRQMREGEKKIVKKITATGELGRRIREMGILVGCEVEMLGKAPLRDPVALRVKNTVLSLRNSEADYILVE